MYKTLKTLLIFSILNSFICQQCSTFESNKRSLCTSINQKCGYYPTLNSCHLKDPCSEGIDTSSCSAIDHPLHNQYKCEFGTECREVRKKCSEYDFSKGPCSDLTPESGTDVRCDSSIHTGHEGSCEIHHNQCTGLSEEDCPNNLPLDATKKCVYQNGACVAVPRDCNDNYENLITLVYSDPSNCNKLSATNEKKICISSSLAQTEESAICSEIYANCEDYIGDAITSAECSNIKPWLSDKKEYDSLNKCESKEGVCTKVPKICSDFIIGQTRYNCQNYTVATETDSSKKHCVYDPTKTIGQCYEEFKSCSLYNQEPGKTQDGCENIILRDITKKCVWNNNQCVQENKVCEDWEYPEPEEYCNSITLGTQGKHCKYISNTLDPTNSECIEDYKSCEDYLGHDKKICVKINSVPNCYLDKDYTCKTKTVTTTTYCDDVGADKEKCLNKAVPRDNKKKCLFISGTCQENFERCEDYDGGVESTCEAIRHLFGIKCVYDSTNNICKSKVIDKCAEARNIDECELIEKTGVTNQSRFKCYWYASSYTAPSTCIEHNKYCSDYAGDVASGITLEKCKLITPFDQSGNNIEQLYKCTILEDEPEVGCQKLLKDCNEANSPSQCALISAELEKTTNKYCLFYNRKCEENYKTCADYAPEDAADFNNDKCTNNLPKKYKTHHCIPGTNDDGKKICEEEENSCEYFNSKLNDNDYCNDIDLLCSYSTEGTSCSKIEGPCSEIKFAELNVMNSAIAKTEICKRFETDKIRCTFDSVNNKCQESEKPVFKEPDTKIEPISSTNIEEPKNEDHDKEDNNPEQENGNENTPQEKSFGGKMNGFKFILFLINLLLL